jgi:hypothetical protein
MRATLDIFNNKLKHKNPKIPIYEKVKRIPKGAIIFA